LGDITESSSNASEWKRASAAWNKLYGQIPFAVNQGNHDSILSINKYFPVANFSDELGGAAVISANIPVLVAV
jgi:hypothetical protein